MALLLATGLDLKKRERGYGEIRCLCRGCLCGGAKDGESCLYGCCFSGGCIIQIYVDDDRDKVGIVEKGEYIEFIDIVDFDSVFDFLHFFYFSDFLRLRGGKWRLSGEVFEKGSYPE